MTEPRKKAATQRGTVLLLDSQPSIPRGQHRSLLFSDPVEWLEARELEQLPGLFSRLEAARAGGLWAAGYVSYECGYHWEPSALPGFQPGPGLPLAAFGLYREPLPVSAGAIAEKGSAELLDCALEIGPDDFARKVEAIHRSIERGESYQVNLTDRFRGRFRGGAAALFAHMMEAQPVAFGALLHLGECAIVSASPELFFRLKGRDITVCPMKGTAERGRDSAEDAERMRRLAADEKNRAENVMIVDLLRSDLGRIAEVGSVQVDKLFAVERLPSLLQMTSSVSAALRPEVSLYEVFRALFPSGSIVGAPKVQTMRIIRELECRDRGPYTGAIGFQSPDGEAVFSVAIRTAVLEGERLTMGVGAGITYDSAAGDEYSECLLKGEFLRDEPFALIESLRWEEGRCELLERHFDRLEASAEYFGLPWNREEVLREFGSARLPAQGVWKVRVVLDRAGCIQVGAPEPVGREKAPLRVVLWPEPVRSGDRFLRHKTTRRPLYDRALAQARAQGYVDALFHNERGAVTEGAIHNILVRHGERWRTPPLDAGVLPGVFRSRLLDETPGLAEEEFTVEQLLAADEVWLCNAVRGVRVLESPREQIAEARLPGARAIVRT